MSAEAAHSQVPSDTEPISRMAHQLAFGAKALEEHDQLQFEEDDRINRGPPSSCIGLLHELAHKREIKRSFQMAVEVILWNQVFK